MVNTNSNGFPGEYDPDANLYRVYYDDQTSEPVSTVVVKAVAVLTDTPPTELDPLYEVLDPDALNQLYATDEQPAHRQVDSHIAFAYNGCQVTVFWTGLIEIVPPDEL